jgi:hypothetical protein
MTVAFIPCWERIRRKMLEVIRQTAEVHSMRLRVARKVLQYLGRKSDMHIAGFAFAERMMHLKDRCVRAVVIVLFVSYMTVNKVT